MIRSVALLGIVCVITFAPGSRFRDDAPVFFRWAGVERIAGGAVEAVALPVLVVSGVVGSGGRFLGMVLWKSEAGNEERRGW